MHHQRNIQRTHFRIFYLFTFLTMICISGTGTAGQFPQNVGKTLLIETYINVAGNDAIITPFVVKPDGDILTQITSVVTAGDQSIAAFAIFNPQAGIYTIGGAVKDTGGAATLSFDTSATFLSDGVITVVLRPTTPISITTTGNFELTELATPVVYGAFLDALVP